jgi:hypothetical protein
MECDMITEAVNRKLPTPQQIAGCEVNVAGDVEMFAAGFKRATGLLPFQNLHSPKLIKLPWMPLMLLRNPFRRVVFGTPPDPIVSTDPTASAGAKFVKGADFTPPRISLGMRDLDADIGTTRIL